MSRSRLDGADGMRASTAPLIKLTAAEPKDGYELLLTSSDDTCGVYDLAPFIAARTETTAPLADSAYFA